MKAPIKQRSQKRSHRPGLTWWVSLAVGILTLQAPAQQISSQLSLQAVVTPSTVIWKDGRPVTFALHGFIEFKSLAEMFPYIELQTKRWRLSEAQQQGLAHEFLRQGIESRVVSMTDERPIETIITHTSEELRHALAQVKEPVPPGYEEAFLAVQEKWKHSLNCWSASPSIQGRVLSNWYPIEEGIQLYGATYDSTEHFWQAVKYHPDITVDQLEQVLTVLERKDWTPWLAHLDGDPTVYLPNAYAIEFLRHNLTTERFRWFREEIARQRVQATDHVRLLQQRGNAPFRFGAYEEKVLWGDLADTFHLVYTFSAAEDPIRQTLAAAHFDAIYLGSRKLPFISEELRSLMLEVFKVKYLQMPRFREVIRSVPRQIRIEHYLNDGDSPDIPIPVYVGYLNQVRDLAWAQP